VAISNISSNVPKPPGNGGEAVGVIPEFMLDYEVAHAGLTELHVVETMHERKAMLYKIIGF
jgi:predicted Rossmann-fold nucleotide-binding protein